MRLTIPLLFLLLSASALTVNKSVEGSHLLNIGQSLSVTVVVETETSILIDRIEDPIPSSTEAVDLPSGCRVVSGLVNCEYGTEIDGKITITYQLRAKEKSKSLIIDSARTFYEVDGIPSTSTSNPIPGLYYIGPPELNITSQKMLIDSREQEKKFMTLPESTITLVMGLKNSGAVPAENITLELSVNEWGVSLTQSLTPLQPDEDQPFRISFVSSKNEGKAEIKVRVSWQDSIEHQERQISTIIPIEVSRPHVKAQRELQLLWQSIDDELIPSIKITYSMKNEGKLMGKVIFKQEMPELAELDISPTGETIGRNTTVRLELEEGEAAQVVIQGKAEEGSEVSIPPAIIEYYDSRNYKYDTFSWPQETVQVSRSVWAIIYGLIAPLGDTFKLLILIIFFTFIWLTYKFFKVEDENWKYLLILPVICFLILITYFKIEGIGWLLDLVFSLLGGIFIGLKNLIFGS